MAVSAVHKGPSDWTWRDYGPVLRAVEAGKSVSASEMRRLERPMYAYRGTLTARGRRLLCAIRARGMSAR